MTSEYGQHDVGFTGVTISGYEIPISVYSDVGPDIGVYPISGIPDIMYTLISGMSRYRVAKYRARYRMQYHNIQISCTNDPISGFGKVPDDRY